MLVEILLKVLMVEQMFFLPSREETEGIVVLEALACKTQILLRDIPAF